MHDLSIAIIQTALHWEDIGANLAMFEEKIWQIDKPIDLIVLPEMFSTGFSMNATSLAETLNGRTMKWMKQIASQTGAAVTGSIIIKEGMRFYNRLIWMYPDGNYATYDKRHTFTLTGENEIYHHGNKKLIIQIKGWKICPMICYDLRFPIWSRNRAIADSDTHQFTYDYDLCIYVANWPASRSYAWTSLLKARAIENSCYVVGSNIIGRDGRGFTYEGNSLICNPLETLHVSGNTDQTSVIILSNEWLIDYRMKYPFLLDSDDFSITGLGVK